MDGLVANGKELEFTGCTGEITPYIVENVETKLTHEIKSKSVFPEGYIISKEGKKKRQRRELDSTGKTLLQVSGNNGRLWSSLRIHYGKGKNTKRAA